MNPATDFYRGEVPSSSPHGQVPNPREAPAKITIDINELKDYNRFRVLYTRIAKLGEGGDGAVYAYEDRSTKAVVAVKTAHGDWRAPSDTLMKEASNLQLLGKHDHIVEMLSYSVNFLPRPPAIFLPLCEFGDLYCYKKKLWKQQRKPRTSEVTIWKLLKDMSLALNFIHNHNKQRACYIHHDLKPGNILVTFPAGGDRNRVPVEPVFKLTDFSRMREFPISPDADADKDWHGCGTPEYAPSASEQANVRPSGDIWSLGATLQDFALNIAPTQSRESFIRARRAQGKQCPRYNENSSWHDISWRSLIPTRYRPLNADIAELKTKHDVPVLPPSFENSYRPYSTQLSVWYQALWNPNEVERISAATLVRECVPLIDGYIAIAKSMEHVDQCFDRARKLREQTRRRQAGRPLLPAKRVQARKPPSYEGNEWDSQ
ncbi:kinase-like protein [Decorospora gaudefroyi]|uniref:non-specific serine/threonine protein kinase n=1 Tax=Decorospora gaudefroyi TaxID=184978 RepID=A0A6A5KN51_9PLEO|nr:kinase-like protein [Decorospora gaudefroyi]